MGNFFTFFEEQSRGLFQVIGFIWLISTVICYLLKIAYAKIGGKPGIFWFLVIFSVKYRAFDHSATAPQSHLFMPMVKAMLVK